jgi:hypothetical protein
MKTIGTLTDQSATSFENQLENASAWREREQLIELVDAQLATIGGGGDQPNI